MSWSNWSGSVGAEGTVHRPQTEEELGALVRAASKVRPTGAGHSFMPLCASDEAIFSLAEMEGRLTIAADRTTARIPAGWSIKRLTQELWSQGLALENQGDVNPQSLAGAMATGTHGTGRDLGSIATFARGFRLVGADGTATWCDATTQAELFEAQRLSLGMFGIATEIECDVVPAYHLVERIEKRPWAEVREKYFEMAAELRHVEFWLFPHADDVILKTLEPCDPCDPPPTTTDMEEATFRRLLNIGATVPALVPTLQRLMMRSNMSGHRRGPAHTIFASDRTIPFEEMEYEMPVSVGLETLEEVVGWIRKKRLPVSFPFEFRIVAADDIWMSPMNAGPVAAISMHQYAKMPWRKLFAEAEAIFRAHGGRPHWAKRHTLQRGDVDALYPMAERYREVRRAADPTGKFLNPHLEELFS
ncbi:D-arabinono-1,4-lactone oxidase [Parerythrobacter aestuarii]|uniref:D-arabinono-1,4-lactone oxidase n=1 Tax=Parerythrobacter aestuarii TaxID=3020909 RepID=UPI0024DEEE87|nr:D-arabinono-1,4-lactone oxidase [Parerythrobacter aestuarii]